MRESKELRLYNSGAMTAAQRGEQDNVLCISREAQEDQGRRREDTLRLGAAECGLCLDEFLDSGNKAPRNLLCGHTFCTGRCTCTRYSVYVHVYTVNHGLVLQLVQTCFIKSNTCHPSNLDVHNIQFH